MKYILFCLVSLIVVFLLRHCHHSMESHRQQNIVLFTVNYLFVFVDFIQDDHFMKTLKRIILF
jgi:hypothetical protein